MRFGCFSARRAAVAAAARSSRPHHTPHRIRTASHARAMLRSESMSHIEAAMSSVKSLKSRPSGLDLPNTPRFLRRKHRCDARGATRARGRCRECRARIAMGESRR